VIAGKRNDGHLVVEQLEHARMTGALTEAWGSEAVGGSPHPAAVRAARGHEQGWVGREAPLLDPETGGPLTALAMPVDFLTEVQLQGPAALGQDDPEAALLVSQKHLNRYGEPAPYALVRRRHRLVRRFRRESAALQASLRERSELPRDLEEPAWRAMDACDTISHALIMRRAETRPRVVGPDGQALEVVGTRVADDDWTFSPWPFRPPELELEVGARLLNSNSQTQDELEAAYSQATPITVTYRLRPADSAG